MLADAAVIFAVGGVAGQVEFVFDTPVFAVECEQAVLIGFFGGQAGDAADDIDGGFCSFGAGSADFEYLPGEGEVDPAGGDGGGDNAAVGCPPAGFIGGAMG